MLNNEDQAPFSGLQGRKERDRLDVSPGLPFTIVGIGASAGGLEAFTQLLNTLPATTGMAFVLVQHLDPAHESQLPDILSHATIMPVRQAIEAMAIEPNSVYVIPPNSNITVAGKAIHLTPRVPHTMNLPIDGLFESLASAQGKNSIGVVLSGNGADGSHGLKAIKSQGGITFVQTESSAQFSGMPHSALASSAADFVLSPAQIAQELAAISQHPYLVASEQEKTPDLWSDEEEELQKIFLLVHSSTGVDFSHYKRSTAQRRIGRRMTVRRSRNVGEYLVYLKTHPEEIQDLYRDLLISVTHFFRDPEAFTALATCLRGVLKNKNRKDSFRVWVPGCATGEEVYSLAICVDELFLQEGVRPALQIFGTDISELALGIARAGRYPGKIKGEVSAERLEYYFHTANGDYQINKWIRDLCVFAKQNLIYDPPFSRMDVISCRNTLIYLDGSLQKKTLSTFHYSLNDGGLIFLGPAESTNESQKLFQTLDSKHRIYARNSYTLPAAASAPFLRPESAPPPTRNARLAATTDWRKQADQFVQDRYAPDGVIINQEMTILQLRGRTGYYLQSAALGATQNLLLLAHEALQQPLREAALDAIARNMPVQRKGLHLEYLGEAREINLEVIPLSAASAKERFYFVLLENTSPLLIAEGDANLATQAAESPAQEIVRLKQQNAELSTLLHGLNDDHEVALEEQKAANEEISSANEELQSTNEELSTAKEELQSANEELTTVNEELQNRNQEFSQVVSDLTNVLAAVNAPILMLDRDLLLRRFTPAAEHHFSLSPANLGRSAGDIPILTHVPSIQRIVRTVIDTLSETTKEVQDDQGCWWSLTIRPYRTVDNRIDGAVLTFANIDSLKRSLQAAEAARSHAEGIVDTVTEPLLVLDGKLRVKTASRAFYRTFSGSRETTEGKFIYDLGEGEWDIPALRKLLEEVLPQSKSFQDFEVAHDFAVLGQRILLLNARQLWTADGQLDLVLLAMDDVTERRRLQDDLRASNEDLQRFAYAAAHDLRAPLDAAMRASHRLTEGLAGKLDEHESNTWVLLVESMVRLRKLMEDILTYSGMGHTEQHLEVMPLAWPLKIALANLQSDIESSGAKINAGALPTLPVDSSRIAMVFQNLIDNALKYRRAEEPKIDIAAVPLDRYWQISVRDNGRGFSSKYVARAFEPFKRLSQSDIPGSGIGLATCKRIVERLGGRIWAESIPGEGSIFYFTLLSKSAKAASAG